LDDIPTAETYILASTLADTGSSVTKSLPDLTRAYTAIEGLLRSQLLSEETRKMLERYLAELDLDITKAMRAKRKAEGPDVAAD
jgi:hypothetical protein